MSIARCSIRSHLADAAIRRRHDGHNQPALANEMYALYINIAIGIFVQEKRENCRDPSMTFFALRCSTRKPPSSQNPAAERLGSCREQCVLLIVESLPTSPNVCWRWWSRRVRWWLLLDGSSGRRVDSSILVSIGIGEISTCFPSC